MSQARQTSTHRPPTTKPLEPKVHDPELVDALDELMDEIDRTLEENTIVHQFRQRSGE